MHLTGHEIELIPSAVAAIAIIGSYFGVRSANHNSRLMAKDQYLQGNQTQTYISILKGIHFRALLLQTRINQRPGEQLPTALQKADLSSDDEALFSAQLYAYSTNEIYKRWVEFSQQSRELEELIVRIKSTRRGLALTSLNARDFTELAPEVKKWRQARVDLINLVRSELRINRRNAPKFKFPDDADYLQ